MKKASPSALRGPAADYNCNQPSPEALELGLAMERYKRQRNRPFPDCRDILAVAKSLGYRKQERVMHYRNGREAKNGDKIVSLAGYGTGPVTINAVGILYDAKPGNDYCNGNIASTIGGPLAAACLCDCLHADDLAALLAEKGLDKRPAGK